MDPMGSERGPYPIPQTQASDIDPRLQEAVQAPQPYSNPPPEDATPNQFRLPSPPPRQQQQQQQQQQHQHHQQPQYPGPPQWPQDGYDPYYAGPPGQQPPPITHMPQHMAHAYTYQPHQTAGSGIPPQPTEASFSESKRPRACEACRGLKVRCEPDSGNGPCKRCAKANRNCVITPPSRKRQKKTDSRVAELERKLDALRAEVNAKGGNLSISEDENYEGNTSHLMGTTPKQQSSPYSAFSGTGQKRRRSEYQQDGFSAGAPSENAPAILGQNFAPRVANMIPDPHALPQPGQIPDTSLLRGLQVVAYGETDVVDRGLLSMSTAEELFAHYTHNMVPHMPIVVFPSSTTCDSLRKTAPILFLAVMTVASGQDYPHIHGTLNTEVMAIFGDRFFVKGEKSLEIVQALQVVTIWYWPDPNGNSKYYQFIHNATVMAMELGMDRKPRPIKGQGFQLSRSTPPEPNTETSECRRAWLGCYLLSSSIAMGKKRPSLVLPNVYVEECMSKLAHSENAIDSDNILVHWVKLQILADDVAAQISPDFVNLTEAKVRTAYRAFERQLKDWDEERFGLSDSLTISLAFNVVKLYMHELALQHETGPDPAKPSRSRGKSSLQGSPSGQTASPRTAFEASLGILDTFSKFNVQQIRTLPIFQFAQVAHASVSMLKMFFVAKTDPDFSKQAPVTLPMIEQHLSRIIHSLRMAASEGKSLGAHTFLMVFVTMQKIFEEHKEDTLETMKMRYGCLPDTKQAQTLDLEEPIVTPQRRVARRSGESSDEALHMLSEVAMGKSGANGYKAKDGQTVESTSQQPGTDGGDMAAMGKLIGEGDLGTMSDDGFFGIMQTMWARSS